MDIASGYTALTAAFQLAKGLKDVHDQVKINEIVIELQGKIMEAQEAVRDGRDKMQEMQSALEQYQNWEHTSSSYKLKLFNNNNLAYEFIGTDQPNHFICPNCYENKRRSILQYKGDYFGEQRYDCKNCKSDFVLGNSGATRLD